MIFSYFELVALIVLIAALGWLLKLYEQKRREVEELKKQRTEIEFQARQKAVRLLEEARDKGMKIVLEATAKAGRDQTEITEELRKLGEEQQDIYKQMIQSISKKVEKEAVREINQLSEVLEMETAGVQKMVGEKLEEEYKKSAIEIDQYKLQKLREINLKLRDLITDISRTVIGKNISIEEHSDLVIKALAEAKQKYGL